MLIFNFVLSAILSGYHIGVEQGIFSGLVGCSSDNLSILDKSNLLKSLDDITVSCKNTYFTLFGLSLASVNFFISSLISIIVLIIIKNEKNR